MEIHLEYWHPPLIKSEENKGILITSDGRNLQATLYYEGGNSNLPVTGCPKQAFTTSKGLHSFLSCSWPCVQRERGNITAIKLTPGLKGGTKFSEELLQNFSGYAIGNIIHEVDFLLPPCKRELQDINAAIIENEGKRERVRASEEFRKADSQKKGWLTDSYSAKINTLKKKREALAGKIEELTQSRNQFATEEALPIDYLRSKVQSIHNGAYSEFCHKIVISKSADIRKEIIEMIAKINSSGGRYNLCLSDETVEEIIEEITHMQKSSSYIEVIASLVTLSKSQIMNPIVLQRGTTVSQNLKEQRGKYRVLTEAVLGGVFFGYSIKFEGADSERNHQFDNVFFIAKGGIASSPATREESLLSAYNSWKASLLGPNGGYPIALKWNYLENILLANGVNLN